MLEDLDKVNWAELSHAHGSAENIPDVIRRITSADKKLRDKAYFEFYADIINENIINEASSHTVPFLIELLELVDDKYNVLDLIRNIACSVPAYETQLSFAKSNKNNTQYELEAAKHLEWAKKAYFAAKEGLETYYKLLEHPNWQVREASIRLIAVFREEDVRETSSKKLYDRFAIEENNSVKAWLIRALGFLATPNTLEAELLQALVNDNSLEIPLAQIAAVSLARILGETTPKTVNTILVEAIKQALWVDWDIFDAEEACQGLEALGTERAVPALVDALNSSQSGEDIYKVTRSLLDLTFRDRKQDLPTLSWIDEDGIYNFDCILTPEQDNLWQNVHTNIYQAYGLPVTRDELANLIV